MSDLQAGLSITFEIGDQVVPVQTETLELSGGTLKEKVKEAIEQGAEFRLPPGQAIEVQLDKFTTWLESGGLDLPDGFDDVISGTTLTISSLCVSTKGAFDIALKVDLAEGIM
ncbi:MAG: hypothetical protein PVF47_10345, partial [Anaerolineae bacterium]